MLPEVLEPQVLGNLAQPDGDLAGPVKAVHGFDGLVKGLLGQLLGKAGVAALGKEKLINRLGVLLVNLLHVLQGPQPPFTGPAGPLFLFIYPRKGGNVTGIWRIFLRLFSREPRGTLLLKRRFESPL